MPSIGTEPLVKQIYVSIINVSSVKLFELQTQLFQLTVYCQETEEETVKTYRKRIMFTWIYALFWASVPLFGWTSYGLDQTTQTCTITWWDNGLGYKSFIVTFAGLGFLIPALVIIICYWKATRKLREKSANNDSDPLTSYWDNIKDVTFVSIHIREHILDTQFL